VDAEHAHKNVPRVMAAAIDEKIKKLGKERKLTRELPKLIRVEARVSQ
jgi:hypothetical protein